MSAEHKRPLVAFLLVALVCAFTVGQSVRDAALRQLVNAGLPLVALVPIAPNVLLGIELSTLHGRGGDDPSLRRAILAVAGVHGSDGTLPTGSGGSGLVASTADGETAVAFRGSQATVSRAAATASHPVRRTLRSSGIVGTPSTGLAVSADDSTGKDNGTGRGHDKGTGNDAERRSVKGDDGKGRAATAHDGTSQHAKAQPAKAQHATAQHAKAQHGKAHHGKAQHAKAQHGKAQHGKAHHAKVHHAKVHHAKAHQARGHASRRHHG